MLTAEQRVALMERLREFGPNLGDAARDEVMHVIRCCEVVEIMEAIDSGAIAITEQQRQAAQNVFAGNAEFALPNGWRLVVFNDADSWDYLDRAEAPDGWTIDFDAMPGFLSGWRSKQPGLWGMSE